ncbi:MAG: hypothetical protein V4610_15725 [Pseudomonadota bacterium]|jgi:hypothetical protein
MIAAGLVRLLSAASAFFAAGVGISPQLMDSAKAPAAWVSYAQRASAAIKIRIESDAPAAVRFREELHTAHDHPAALPLRLWVDGRGIITRAEFPSLMDKRMSTDFAALLHELPIHAAPPKGMLLPMRLSIAIAPE